MCRYLLLPCFCSLLVPVPVSVPVHFLSISSSSRTALPSRTLYIYIVHLLLLVHRTTSCSWAGRANDHTLPWTSIPTLTPSSNPTPSSTPAPAPTSIPVPIPVPTNVPTQSPRLAEKLASIPAFLLLFCFSDVLVQMVLGPFLPLVLLGLLQWIIVFPLLSRLRRGSLKWRFWVPRLVLLAAYTCGMVVLISCVALYWR
jgi:hypothetical protein